MTFGTQGQGFPGSIWQILLFLMQVEEVQEIGHHVSPHLLYGHVQVSIIKQSVFWSNSYRYPIPLFMYLHAPHVSVILKYRSTDLHFALHWGGGEKKKKNKTPNQKSSAYLKQKLDHYVVFLKWFFPHIFWFVYQTKVLLFFLKQLFCLDFVIKMSCCSSFSCTGWFLNLSWETIFYLCQQKEI